MTPGNRYTPRRAAASGLAAIALACGSALIWHAPAHGGMEIEDLLPPEQEYLDEDSRREQAQRIEQEREAARRRAEARAREEEAKRLREQARLEALPPGERLIRENCLACHERQDIARTGRSRLSWRGTLLRMQVFQDARLSAEDRRRLVEHLGREHPPTTGRVALEVTILVLVAAIPVGGFRTWLHYRRRSRQ
jgi:hypothetical protein